MFANTLSNTAIHYSNYGDTIHKINVVVICKQIILYNNYICLHSLNGRVKDMEKEEERARGTGMGRAAATAGKYFYDNTHFNNKLNKSNTRRDPDAVTEYAERYVV